MSSGIDSKIARAVSQQSVNLERVAVTGSAIGGGSGVLIGIYLAVAVHPGLGIGVALYSAAAAVWFLIARTLLGRGVGTRLFRIADPLVEVSVPAAIMVIEAWTLGPVRSLGSSVAPAIYVLICVLAVLRLQAMIPITIGLIGGISYALIFHVVFLPKLPEQLLTSGAIQPTSPTRSG